MSLHKDLTGADLHEPKGITSATAGQVYQADGAGSGTWSTLTIPTGQFNITTAVFTSDGTWTKPAGCFMLEVICIGGGGATKGGAISGTASNFGPGLCQADGGSSTSAGTTGIGDIIFAGAPGGSDATKFFPPAGLRYGQYGCGADADGVGTDHTGGGAAAALKYIYTVPASASVIVGTAAAGSGGYSGKPGVVIVKQYITV